MKKNKYIISTSVLISLLLFNVDGAIAETSNDVSDELSIEKYESYDDKVINSELINRIDTITNLPQTQTLTAKDTEAFKSELIILITAEEHSIPVDRQNRILQFLEMDEQSSFIVLESIKANTEEKFKNTSDVLTYVNDMLKDKESKEEILELFEGIIEVTSYLENSEAEEKINTEIVEEEQVNQIETEQESEKIEIDNSLQPVEVLPENQINDVDSVEYSEDMRPDNTQISVIENEGLKNVQTELNYRGYLTRASDTINTVPWGEPGHQVIRNVSNIVGREVLVHSEMVTQRATWLYVEVLGANVSGWVDKKGVQAESILTETNVNYRGYLNRATDTINTLPWGMPGYTEIRKVDELEGREVRVLKEAVTQRATWVYIEVAGTNISGWIDKKGIDIERILNEENVRYRGVLSRRTDTINTQPWGTVGYKEIQRVNDLLGREVEILREATTQRATWLYINVLGTNISGWIDKAGITAETIINETDVNYRGYLSRETDTINTYPWGTPGYREVRRVTNLKGREVKITKEAITPRATWLYIEIAGTNVKGWIDKAGVSPEAISKQTNEDHRGYLLRSTDTINTLPWGMKGYREVRRVADLQGKEVRVLREATTQRATWLYIEVLGTGVKGWIDKAGVSPEAISKQTDEDHRGYLLRSTDTINTLPWGMKGYREVRRVTDLQGKEVRVIHEVTTQRATWLYIEVLGTGVKGWIDKAGVKPEAISSQKNVNYRAFLLRENDTINTSPWGMPGYRQIRKVNDLVNREIHVTKEAVTDRATWVYITVVGEEFSGWIDKNGIIQTSIAYRNTYYNLTFEEALAAQMRAGYPQTDAYGGGWKNAKEADVARYLNPKNFVDVSNNGYLPKIESIQITTGTLNIRNAPTTSGSRVLGTVTRNQVFNILDVSNGWYKINVNGIDGWISGDYVALISEIQYLPKDRLGTVNTAVLNVRSAPSTSGAVITTIRRGETYSIIDEENGWYKLNINGISGWVSGDFLNISLDINRDNLQFLSLSSPSGLSVKDLNEILKGKGILEGTGAAFLEASQKYGVNEIYLISHALLETGNGTSQLATGMVVEGKTVYNMYGIGAVDSNPLGGGSRRAFEEGWDTPEKSIIGGAEFINSSYVNSPVHKQDTLYKMKWNPANPPTRYQSDDGVWVNVAHQYATDIGWAVKQTRTLDLITEYSTKYNLVLKFDIPIYK